MNDGHVPRFFTVVGFLLILFALSVTALVVQLDELERERAKKGGVVVQGAGEYLCAKLERLP